MTRRSAVPAFLVVSLLAAACSDVPTGPTPDLPDVATVKRAVPLTPDDFAYEEIRHPDGGNTFVNRMNARGDIVGDNCAPGGACVGYARRGDTWETIAYPGSSWTTAYGISERGDVVGIYGDATGQHGYVYTRGEYRTLDAPDGVQTRAYDISANGIIAGAYRTDGKWQPAMWEKDGRFVQLDDLAAELGADMAEGFGINAHGAIVGHYTVAGDIFPGTGNLKMYGYVYQDGRITATLNYPGSGWMSCGWGIGIHGEVLGHYVDLTAGGVTGYLWQDGEYVARMRVPGAMATYPQAITPSGTIAGWAVLPTGERIGFIASRQ